MESKKEVELELEEIATVEEDKEKEDQDKETEDQKKETKAEDVEEGNIYTTLASPSEHEYGVPSSARSYTVNKDTSIDIHRRLRVYRIVSLVLFVICVLLLIVVLVLFMNLTGKQPCQEVQQIASSPPEQECSLKKCEELYPLPQRLCSDCGKGWLRFENTCYFLSQNRLTWQQSRQECQRKGGDLAVITNERVQMYLSKKGTLNYWIGLNHLVENEWKWINNTVLTVRYWGDMSFPGECAILAGNDPPERSWRPSSCSLYLQYICQKM